MNIKELEKMIREIKPNLDVELDVENVLKIMEEKEQEINPAQKAYSEYPFLQRT